ncbi:MAG: class I SAM-dependent methyltransferase [Beijerinckiaceae bacterium]|nr:class I SAM-dependent methyltransferase [Beijerinckiaceae bacterium]
MPDEAQIPLCPVSGRPAARHIQWVSARLLMDLWRIEFKTDARPAFRGIDRFGLWESPLGLYFFDPKVEGDRAFYVQFYSRVQELGLFSQRPIRQEFTKAARRIKSGARVLDVGCGLAHFRSCLTGASYTGLDPNFAECGGAGELRSESLAQHLIEHAGEYDAVCAFQVIEHVKFPAELFLQMVQAAKPGGLIFAGVPHVPSSLTRIPNFVMNAPPHHLTWWTKSALAELANGAGASVETIEHVPWGIDDSLIYWVERCTPIKCNGEYFRGAWSWHAACAFGLIGGLLAHRLAGVPSPGGEGAGLLLTARRAMDAN